MNVNSITGSAETQRRSYDFSRRSFSAGFRWFWRAFWVALDSSLLFTAGWFTALLVYAIVSDIAVGIVRAIWRQF